MDKQIRMMDKIMRIALLGCLIPYLFITQGMSIGIIGGIVVIVMSIGMGRHNKTLDERQMQGYVLSGYAACITTICFILIMSAVEFIKTSRINPCYGMILAVLCLSQWAFGSIFKRIK